MARSSDEGELKRRYGVLRNHAWNTSRAAKALNIPRTSMQSSMEQMRRAGWEIGEPGVEDHSLRYEVQELKNKLRASEKRILTEQRIEEDILKLTKAPIRVPEWALTPKGKVSDLTGVPILLASDWHWGEVVKPTEINNQNAYNLEIARQRARTLIQVTCELMTKHIGGAKTRYEGAVLVLAGDMVSGDIHPELTETNSAELYPCILDLLGVLSWSVETLLEVFPKLLIVGVVGNHGRNSKKPRAKRRAFNNADWLLYRLLQRELQRHPSVSSRVSFLIPDGADAFFRIYGTRYLGTHGDQYRGGDGFAGAVVPVARGDRKKRAQAMSIDRAYDVQMMGHWHTYLHGSDFIMNGSLVGWSEFAQLGVYSYEAPQQALWITHPEHGITFRCPVFVDRQKRPEAGPSWAAVGV